MEELNPYQIAYQRERVARLHAEKALDDKSRHLYDSCLSLEKTVTELKMAQGHLIQSEKMASIGQLAAGVAHEINNPIGFALSNMNTMTEYLEAILKLDQWVMNQPDEFKQSIFFKEYLERRNLADIEFIASDVHNLLSDSIKGLNRVSNIVKSLKKVTHASSAEWELRNVNDLIEESIKVVWNELKYSMQIEKKFGELPLLHCHEGEIHQVLMNFFINASHACENNPPEKPGTLWIKTMLTNMEGKNGIAIQIDDNGKGMSKDTMKRMFDPFFTTKAVGVGTGLGLSISLGVVQRHGGNISVMSKEGLGTCFQIFLPIQAEPLNALNKNAVNENAVN